MAEDAQKNIITGILEFIKELPGGESIIIILLSLVLFYLYWYFFHKKPLKEVVKEKISEKTEPLKKVITDRDSKIKELENEINELKTSNIKLMIQTSQSKIKYDVIIDTMYSRKGPIKEYSKGE